MWAHLVIMKIVWSSPLARKNKAHAYGVAVDLRGGFFNMEPLEFTNLGTHREYIGQWVTAFF